jgi:DNA polymerase I-like protein with 3'-5' exonuclease and polymerase domains
MNFEQLVDSGQTPKVEPYPWMKTKRFTLVRDLDHLREVVDAAIKSGECALDLETEGLDNRIDSTGRTIHKIVGYCLSFDGEEGFYVPVGHVRVNHKGESIGVHEANLPRTDTAEEIRRLCENCVTIYHNAGFDHEFLYGSGSRIQIEQVDKFEDTLILDYLRDSTDKRHGLKHLAERFLGMEMIELKDLFLSHTKSRDFSTLDPTCQNTLWYAGSDGICTYLLLQFYKKHNHRGEPEPDPKKTIYGEQKAVYAIEKALVPALRWTERNRPKVDIQYVHNLKREVELLMEDCVRDIRTSLIEGIKQADGSPLYNDQTFPYDVNSPQQLGNALKHLKETNRAFAHVELDVTEKSQQVQTNNESIEKIIKVYGKQFPFLSSILRFRTLQKVLGTYIDPIYENTDWKGRIKDHTIRFKFLANRVDTGRFAASKGESSQGYSGINVQSAPACYNSAEILVKKVYKRPQGMGDTQAVLDSGYLKAVEKTDFLKRVYDGHFIQDNRDGQEYCIRSSCDGCPFESSCERGRPVAKKFYSVESAVRPAIVAREGYVLVAIDYGGLELRAAANLSDETVWIDEFLHGEGDLHRITAQIIYGENVVNLPPAEYKLKRQDGKATNFSIIYGGGGNAIARATGVDSKEGWDIRNKMLKGLPRFNSWMQNVIKTAHRDKEVSTVIGRKIRLHDINSSEDWLRAKQERNAINSIVQGSATGDLIKYSMGSVYRKVRELDWWDICRMMLTIHDELVFEIRQDKLDEVLPVINECMTEFANRVKWKVPLTTDIELNTDWSPKYDWNQMHTIDPKSGMAFGDTPEFLIQKIKMDVGMWYKDGEGNKFVWNGRDFLPYQDFIDLHVQKMSLALVAEGTGDNPTKVSSDEIHRPIVPRETQANDTTEDHKKEVEEDMEFNDHTTELAGFPVYRYRMTVAITSDTDMASYWLRLRKVRDAMKAMAKLKRIHPTHILCVEDVHGNKYINPAIAKERVLVDPNIFELFAIYEGI